MKQIMGFKKNRVLEKEKEPLFEVSYVNATI